MVTAVWHYGVCCRDVGTVVPCWGAPAEPIRSRFVGNAGRSALASRKAATIYVELFTPRDPVRSADRTASRSMQRRGEIRTHEYQVPLRRRRLRRIRKARRRRPIRQGRVADDRRTVRTDADRVPRIDVRIRRARPSGATSYACETPIMNVFTAS